MTEQKARDWHCAYNPETKQLDHWDHGCTDGFEDVHVVEYSALEAANAKIAELEAELAYYKNGTQIKEVHHDEMYAVDNAELTSKLDQAMQVIDEMKVALEAYTDLHHAPKLEETLASVDGKLKQINKGE